ncbi:pancreatic lipase-related protein 3-like [Aethina tumida]|uniref:pancreatic lipase-related protein 3-like n=1 Tax=Aethina tumida TaxID=116153 RepID=UPI0021489B24|nr:pancreatic lipase-related protein 3-like [Aethina tumida]
MGVSDFLFVCLISSLPGPPGVRIEDAYVQLFPVSKQKCHKVDPVRDISYQLYTRHNPLQPQPLRIGDDQLLQASHLNFSEPTVLFFHAFFESYQATPATTIKTAYLQRGDHNIILLNAQRLEAGPWYLTASKNTMVVGEYTAKFIDYLVSRGLYLPSLHLIGLSLGAQMAGVCGQNVRSGRISRITGLDPAGPLFTKWPKSLKLDPGDADFVDVIHTDAGIFGYPRQVGHVDFWPNQGISPQPGCSIPEVHNRNPDTILEKFFCSHWRSYQFYAESVVDDRAFWAVSCANWDDYAAGNCNSEERHATRMGLYIDYSSQGNYFLRTNPESPFSMT